MSKNRNKFYTFSLFLALNLMVSCASKPLGTGDAGHLGHMAVAVNGETSEGIVAKRAQEHLDALRAGDWDLALGYTSPGLRQLTRSGRYANRYRSATSWTGAKVERVVCESLVVEGGIAGPSPAVESAPVRCVVYYMLSYVMEGLGVENTREMENIWLSVDGQWYIFEQ